MRSLSRQSVLSAGRLSVVFMAFGVVLSSCAVLGRSNRVSVGPDLPPDTGVVMIRVSNNEWYDIAVLLESGENVRKVGIVQRGRWAFFVLTSQALGSIAEFTILVAPLAQQAPVYPTRRIVRAPGKLVLVNIAMGYDNSAVMASYRVSHISR